MKSHDSTTNSTATNATNINLFKKFELSDAQRRFLKGGTDIIIDDTVDN